MHAVAAIALAILTAGLMGTAPTLSLALFIAAYYVARGITVEAIERFSALLFLLAAGGFVAAFL